MATEKQVIQAATYAAYAVLYITGGDFWEPRWVDTLTAIFADRFQHTFTVEVIETIVSEARDELANDLVIPPWSE